MSSTLCPERLVTTAHARRELYYTPVVETETEGYFVQRMQSFG